jgi:hypothetical protein
MILTWRQIAGTGDRLRNGIRMGENDQHLNFLDDIADKVWEDKSGNSRIKNTYQNE